MSKVTFTNNSPNAVMINKYMRYGNPIVPGMVDGVPGQLEIDLDAEQLVLYSVEDQAAYYQEKYSEVLDVVVETGEPDPDPGDGEDDGEDG